jgi:hypothetical protein
MVKSTHTPWQVFEPSTTYVGLPLLPDRGEPTLDFRPRNPDAPVVESVGADRVDLSDLPDDISAPETPEAAQASKQTPIPPA